MYSDNIIKMSRFKGEALFGSTNLILVVNKYRNHDLRQRKNQL